MNRRRFIRSAGATGLALATLPTLVDSFAVKALAYGDTGFEHLLDSTDRILVLIQLTGGNDGLNTVIPYTNPKYFTNRPTIAIPQSKALRLNDTLGWHPSLSGFRSLYDEGRLAVVQGVTYPNPDRSHFRGTDIWLTSTDADVFGSTGWVGRYLQTISPGYPQQLPEHPLAVQIGTSMSLGFTGPNGSMGISFRDPDEFYRLVNSGGGGEEIPAGNLGDTPAGREVDFMRSVSRASNIYATVVKTAADKAATPTTQFPNTDIGNKLKAVSQLIRGGLKSRVYMVSWQNGNFDTHANQVSTADTTQGAHAQLLSQLGDAVGAFMSDMKTNNLDDKVAGMTFSEFGRRVAENGSTGTDHGTAAPLFVFGKDVDGGKVFGNDPDLTNLDERGDLLMVNDYRNVYASVLLQWFGTNTTTAQSVLFKDLSQSMVPVFKSAVSVNEGAPSARNRCSVTSMSPNPATGVVTIRADVHQNAHVGITLSDMRGRVVRTVAVDAWTGLATFDVSGLSAGTYVVTLRADRDAAHTFLQVGR